MFYFKDQKNLRITAKEHKYNIEAVEGKIVEVSPSAKGLLIVHVPNKTWNYDINIIERGEIETLVNKLEPLPQTSNEPKVFYAVVLVEDYETYVKDFGFKELPSKTKNNKTTVNSTPPSPQKYKIDYYYEFDYNPRLDRDTEESVYKFISPSNRYKKI